MLHFATYFDSNYLTRGLALLDSLDAHCSEAFTLYVLVLDNGVKEYFEKEGNAAVIPITLTEIENHFPELITAKSNRSVIEYYFTLSPYLPLYILERFGNIDRITTVDADLYFFDDPAIILKTYPSASILITPHNFSPALTHLEVFGKYNVSFQSFKNDNAGRCCLNDWRKQCLDWCGDYYDEVNARFADQKYLDHWKGKFPGVADIEIPGAGLAPWNIEKYTYTLKGGLILVNGSPLIYYHFHYLRIFNKNFAINGLENYKVDTSRKPIKKLYHIYLKKLGSLSSRQLHFEGSILRKNSNSDNKFTQMLRDPNGYWVFTRYLIAHVNLNRTIYKFKKTLKFLWPN
jgi:hypothetical protein